MSDTKETKTTKGTKRKRAVASLDSDEETEEDGKEEKKKANNNNNKKARVTHKAKRSSEKKKKQQQKEPPVTVPKLSDMCVDVLAGALMASGYEEKRFKQLANSLCTTMSESKVSEMHNILVQCRTWISDTKTKYEGIESVTDMVDGLDEPDVVCECCDEDENSDDEDLVSAERGSYPFKVIATEDLQTRLFLMRDAFTAGRNMVSRIHWCMRPFKHTIDRTDPFNLIVNTIAEKCRRRLNVVYDNDHAISRAFYAVDAQIDYGVRGLMEDFSAPYCGDCACTIQCRESSSNDLSILPESHLCSADNQSLLDLNEIVSGLSSKSIGQMAAMLRGTRSKQFVELNGHILNALLL